MALVCDIPQGGLKVSPKEVPDPPPFAQASQAQARLVAGGGCFWCTEAVFQALNGVNAVTSGYAGGTADTAHYQAVCGGSTDHAEVIEITYDPSVINLGRLLKVFFTVAHDPTQLNRQGADRGRQYRSVLFFEDDAQRQYMADYIATLNGASVFSGEITTTLEPLKEFFKAESYHQDYVANNPTQPYVAYNAAPKLQKVREYFSSEDDQV